MIKCQHEAEFFAVRNQISRKSHTVQKHFEISSKFIACCGGVVCHLPWLMIHNIKPTDHGSYHVKGFQDCSIYSRNKWGMKIYTWVESPCMTYGRSTWVRDMASTPFSQHYCPLNAYEICLRRLRDESPEVTLDYSDLGYTVRLMSPSLPHSLKYM